VDATGGPGVERNANDSAEQQLTDVSSLIGEGVDVLIILAKDTEGSSLRSRRLRMPEYR
jgi:ABC-type xylose transport system substrate-binding protein